MGGLDPERLSSQEHTAVGDPLGLISPDLWGVLSLAEGLGRDVLLQELTILAADCLLHALEYAVS